MVNLSESPNALTRPHRTVIERDHFKAEGYQSYEINRSEAGDNIGLAATDSRLLKKAEIVRPVLEGLPKSTLLDLGANSGFFSVAAALEGYQVTAVDMDPQSVSQLRMALLWLGGDHDIEGCATMESIEVWEGRVTQGWKPHDVVLALGIIHWLYDCTQKMGSLEAIVNYLAQQVAPGGTLLVEWVDYTDPVILEHKHLGESAGDWVEGNFRDLLERQFESYEDLGPTTLTRRIYKAVKA